LRKLALGAVSALLLLLLGLYLFRVPLLQWAAAKGGATQNLAVSFEMKGSLFGSVTIDHLKVVPTGPSEINRIEVEHLTARYHLLKLLRGDFTHGIEATEIRNAFVEMTPNPVVAEKLGHVKKEIMKWDVLFHNPAFFIQHIAVDNVNFISHTPAGDVRIERASLQLEPGADGTIKIGHFAIPGYGVWDNVHATARNDRGIVQISGLELDKLNGVDTLTLNSHTRMLDAIGRYKGAAAKISLAVKDEIGRATFDAQIPKVPTLLPQFHSGDFAATGTVEIRQREIELHARGAVNQLTSEQFDVGQADFKISATDVLVPRPKTPLSALRSQLQLGFAKLRLGQYALDQGALTASNLHQKVQVASFTFSRAENTFAAHGSADLPEDLKQIATTPFSLDFTIHAPTLAAFNAEQNLQSLNGALEGSGSLHHQNNIYSGAANLTGTGLNFQGFDTRTFNAKLTLQDRVVQFTELFLNINDRDYVNGWAQINLDAPNAYSGRVQISVADLGIFNPLLHAAQPKAKLAGALNAQWLGNGSLKPQAHRGWLQLTADHVQSGSVKVDHAEFSGNYTPEKASFPVLTIASGPSHFTGQLELAEGKLRLHDMALEQNGLRVLDGFVIVPCDLTHYQKPAELFPLDGRIAANLQADNLDLDKLLGSFGQKSPVSGTVSMTVLAAGSLGSPVATVNLSAQKLSAPQTEKIGPTDATLQFHLAKNQTTLDGTIKQQQMQTLTLRGETELDMEKLAQTKKLDPATPIKLDATLPSSSIAFISKLVPTMRYLEGTLAVDIHATGTVGTPDLRGRVLLNVPAIRFNNQNLPPVNQFAADLRYEGKKIVFQKFGGGIAGGQVSLGGSIDLANLKAPTLALRFKADSALLVRNDSITLRANSDIHIDGPLATAMVKGSVDITKSRFFRDIEILPIQLPGRPAPNPGIGQPTVSITAKPVADWTFDVAIKTHDPFMISGNLANGSVDTDLHLGGTGQKLTLEGYAEINNFTASLPFSKLEVPYGYVYFTKDDPFVPQLDIQGSSSMRGYDISVYIYGDPSNPLTIFTSQPPLPQEEIVSLIATGLTTSEITSNGNAVAGRAAVLAIQSLYRKIFKKSEPTEKESFLDRFQFDIGGVDPRTGRQDVSAQFQLSKRFYLIGALDVQGNLTGQVQYLIRFK
jgi:hypothetical protein